jgi:hypothetical protein
MTVSSKLCRFSRLFIAAALFLFITFNLATIVREILNCTEKLRVAGKLSGQKLSTTRQEMAPVESLTDGFIRGASVLAATPAPEKS